MKRLLPVASLALLLLAACGGTDRPEGVVERWLISLNQGKAGRPDQYAPERLSQRILPHWQTRDPGDLDVIEVGSGKRYSTAFEKCPSRCPSEWLVPFRVERTSGVKFAGTALARRQGDWYVIGLRIGDRSLLVPSNGGQRIGSASSATWGIAIGISAALMLLVAFVIGLTPKPATLPSRKQ